MTRRQREVSWEVISNRTIQRSAATWTPPLYKGGQGGYERLATCLVGSLHNGEWCWQVNEFTSHMASILPPQPPLIKGGSPRRCAPLLGEGDTSPDLPVALRGTSSATAATVPPIDRAP